MMIRPETPADYSAVYELNRVAFDGRDAEPRLVEAIRRAEGFIPELSLVAEEGGAVVGHILFSPIIVAIDRGEVPALSLAPMAVRPDRQRRGIGSALVRHGLAECGRLGHRIVIVVGHAEFYPRFGFSSALAQNLACPFGNCGEAWMALELVPGALQGVWGTVKYPKAFDLV